VAPAQAPAWQLSTWVHALPSLHASPSALAGFEHTPVAGSHEPAVWHWSGAAQVTGLAPAHVPAWQVSLWVQALPSLHAVPLAFGGFEHSPVAGLHEPAVWHWSCAAQVSGLAPEHVPVWQVSVWVQALPSSHAEPFAFNGFEHAPVDGLQTPAVWHWPRAAQTTGFMPVQTPAWQVSVGVQALPSLHTVPSGLFWLEHIPVAGSHTPAP
jgi:hypothetical protein